MRQLRYDEHPRHRLKVGEGFVHGGRLFEVEDDLAEALLADPHVPVTEPMPEAASGDEGETQEVENG